MLFMIPTAWANRTVGAPVVVGHPVVEVRDAFSPALPSGLASLFVPPGGTQRCGLCVRVVVAVVACARDGMSGSLMMGAAATLQRGPL